MSNLMEQLETAARQERMRAIVNNKMSARSLGVDVAFEPEETESIAVGAGLPPIADGQAWKPGLNLVDGTIVKSNGKNYLVIQGHISQAGWEPEGVPALFKEQKADYAEWSQPGGAHDAYMKGDKVTYQGKLYESLVDNNTWSPSAYPAGWKEVK